MARIIIITHIDLRKSLGWGLFQNICRLQAKVLRFPKLSEVQTSQSKLQTGLELHCFILHLHLIWRF